MKVRDLIILLTRYPMNATVFVREVSGLEGLDPVRHIEDHESEPRDRDAEIYIGGEPDDIEQKGD